MRLFFTLLLSATLATAQAGRVAGRVVSTSGEPISKATVRLNAQGGNPPVAYVEMTSSDGRFAFENVAPGQYALNPQRAGYGRDSTGDASFGPQSLEVKAGQTVSGLTLKLQPMGVVSGIVVDSDGDPVPNVQVGLMRYAFSNGALTLSQTSAGATDDRGMYRIPNVRPGRYYVRAMPENGGSPNEIRGASAIELGLPTYYPNALDVRGALALDVPAGEVSNVLVRMQRGRTYKILGTFQSPGAPANVQVTVFPKGGRSAPPGSATNSNAAKGTFDVRGLLPGEYTVVLRVTPRNAQQAPTAAGVPPLPAQAQPAFSGRTDVNISRSDVEVSVRLSPGASVTGRITLEGGAPLSTLTPAVAAPQAQTRQPAPNATRPTGTRLPSLTLLSAEGPSAGMNATVSADGTLLIANVPPLKRTIQVGGIPPNVYVKSIRLGGQDVTHQLLDLTSGAGGVLDIVLSEKAASVTVTARDDKGETPKTPVSIVVWPRTPNPGSSTGGVRVSQAVNLTAQGLEPGDYYAAAFATGGDYLRVPEFLNRFTSRAVRVTLSEGESKPADVTVIPRETIEKETLQFP